MSDPVHDLDRLVAELEGIRSQAPSGASRLEPWLRVVADRDASDLLLLAGEPPALRIHGRIVRSDSSILDGTDTEAPVRRELPPPAQQIYREAGIVDASRRVPDVGRFRINLHRERGRAAATIRMLPRRVPTLASLELPAGTELLTRL